ncbi:unnamed protein product [Prorocentrum cordatum]|uniref:Uncharacterized protein n=1 Tax=Prorocentrum cordatum TaxID=2364126 RepID=A0ABN9WG74_9DINO|nr:unnamed protein product [Polarella glacialis]
MAPAAPPPRHRHGVEPMLETDQVSSSECLLDCPSRQELRQFATEISEETAMAVDGTALEDMMGQHWPVFTVVQATVVILLWLASVVRTRQPNARSGLDLFFVPAGQTLLMAHQDCEDRRWEAWRWFTYQFTHDNLVSPTWDLICSSSCSWASRQSRFRVACAWPPFSTRGLWPRRSCTSGAHLTLGCWACQAAVSL